jgi:hypothetical protein
MNPHPIFAAFAISALFLAACTDPDPEATAGTAAASALPAPPAPAPGEPTLDELRDALARFRDVEVALAEGYVPEPTNTCETADMMGLPASAGAMGVHFMRPDLLQITGMEPRVDGTGTHTDFMNPAVLLYEPQADGSLELVGVENLAFMEAWYAAGHEGPPSFHGVPYDRMVNDPNTEIDEAHFFAPHYDRHVWIFRDNPAGVFAMFNPAVTCEHHQGGEEHGH